MRSVVEALAGERSGREQALARVPFFSQLHRRQLRKLARLCLPRQYPEGKLVVEEGATGLGLFIVTAGRLEVYKTEDGSRLTLGTLQPGDLLGEMALIDDQPRSASAVTLEPTECLLITRDGFNSLVYRDPKIAWSIVPVLAERIRSLHARLLEREQEAAAGDGGKPATAPAGEPPIVKATAEVPALAAAVPSAPPPEATPAAEPPAEEAPAAGTADGVTLLLRLPLAMAMAGATGFAGSGRIFASCLRALSDEVDPRGSESLTEALGGVPRGFVAAGRAALACGAKLAEEVVASAGEALGLEDREDA